jgi:hypothetical protein
MHSVNSSRLTIFTSHTGFAVTVLLTIAKLRMPGYESVEFRAVDGVILRGWLFPAETRSVGVVMSPGVRFSFQEREEQMKANSR